MSSLKQLHRNFRYTLARSIRDALQGTIMAPFYESQVETVIMQFVGESGISDAHKIAEHIYYKFKVAQIKGDVNGRVWLEVNGMNVCLINRYSTFQPHWVNQNSYQIVEFNPTNNCCHILFKTPTPRGSSDFNDLQILVAKAVEVIMTGTICAGCHKLANAEVCMSCISTFNSNPCVICNGHFGKIKNGSHKHCSKERARKRRRKN